MQFSISKEKFARVLYLTNSIVERRNTMPILANVKLTAEDDKLIIAATDLEVSLLGQAEAAVKTAGSTTVDARVLYDIIKELPEENITITLQKGQRLEINSGHSKFKINGISSDEFPTVSGVNMAKPVTIDAGMLGEMLERTAFAMSTDEARYNLNGVLFETEGSTLKMAATDGHRLAYIERHVEGLRFKDGVIVPRKGIQEIMKVLEGNDGVAYVDVNEGFFTVSSEDVTLGIRLVDGAYPDYRKVIPNTSETEVEISRADLLSAVKRVSLVTTDKTKAIKVKVTDRLMTISSSSPEYGEASDTIPIVKKGADIEVGFSSRYIVDLLTALDGSETVIAKFSGEVGPGLFTGADMEGYKCVVMPMRFEQR